MYKFLLLPVICLTQLISSANIIRVSNKSELQEAEKKAIPGDTILLKNGEWKDVQLRFNCRGTAAQPVFFIAEHAGKVVFTGQSQLEIGGSHIQVEGFFFTNGYSGKNAVITFRSGKDMLANNCRVTNCAIEGFNNPGRMEENYWVAFYGKNNRLDHCSFRGKLNLGVLLAVMLDDERSRENFHSIDHNYFGRRIPLASNGGEIIRVGVSQHCEFNSNTIIANNFFEQCDGETEIVSIKSCRNEVKDNVFKECQGSVVLRHGNYNLVKGNYFLGNNKPGSGGVRVINKGQQVLDNVFYQCKGTGFRSPLAVMNGIPNSPAHRYVQVTDAVINGNTFYACAPASFCEGSDAERTLPPDQVRITANIFFTNDTILYQQLDDMKGFWFKDNQVNTAVRQTLPEGFTRKNSLFTTSITKQIAVKEKTTSAAAGAKWFSKKIQSAPVVLKKLHCPDIASLKKALMAIEPVNIILTGKKYHFIEPMHIAKLVHISSTTSAPVEFSSTGLGSLFILEGSGYLILDKLHINAAGMQTRFFIASSTKASSSHFNLKINMCAFSQLGKNNSAEAFFFANKSSVADSIVISQSDFSNNITDLFVMTEEKDNKGYYNAEQISFRNNSFRQHQGSILAVYRGGNDESTMGPLLRFTTNKLTGCNSQPGQPLIHLYGVQQSLLEKNQFTDCNYNAVLLKIEDVVKARHWLKGNKAGRSGAILKNEFTVESVK